MTHVQQNCACTASTKLFDTKGISAKKKKKKKKKKKLTINSSKHKFFVFEYFSFVLPNSSFVK